MRSVVEWPDKAPILLRVGEAAQLLHVHPNTLRRWEALGIIRVLRIGPRHDRRFLRSEIELLLEGANGSHSGDKMEQPVRL